MTGAFKKQLWIKIGVGSGLVLMAILLIQLIVINIESNSQKIARQRQELGLRILGTDSLATLKLDAEKAEPYQSILDNILPEKDRLINFGQDLITMAKKNKVAMEFAFGGEVKSADTEPGFINFSIKADGAYDDFIRFLREVEKSRFLVKFTAADVTRDSGQRFDILASGQVFYR